MEVSVTVGSAAGLRRYIIDYAKIFVTGSVSNQELFRSQSVARSTDPVWDFTGSILAWKATDSLVVEVLEEPNRFMSGRSLGSVTIPIKNLLDNKTIEPKPYPLSTLGTLTLGFSVTTALPKSQSSKVSQKKPRVGIIGSGFSGASSAYYINQTFQNLQSEVEITVFEKSERVGGRVGNFVLAGETLEEGGTVLMDTGVAYFRHFVEQFGLETIPPFDITAPMGIWDGQQFVLKQPHSIIVFLIEMLLSYGIITFPRLLELNNRYVKHYNELYTYLDRHQTFDSGYEMLDQVKLAELTEITMRTFCDERNISGPLYEQLLAGSCRANNGLGPDTLMAYVGILSITLDSRSIYSVKGGNVQVVEKLLEASGATVKTNAKVNEVVKNANGTFTVKHDAGEDEFDSIMIACQLKFANQIKWENISIPPAFAAEREYQTIYEAWAVCEPNDAYFKVKDVPGSILTTDNPETPFASIMPVRKLENGKTIYKATSTTPLTEEVLKTMWKNIEETHVYTWCPAFPAAVPMKKDTWPTYKVDERIYLSNVLETAFSNIESSIMSSKNASSLLVKGLLSHEH